MSNMDETASPATKAVKDKNCPYCHQAFTSSSLGRHLDLYIREKNPKAPDGVHDVDAIRKIRQNITRRQPKGSVARRAASTSAASGKSPVDAESCPSRSPLSPAARGGFPHVRKAVDPQGCYLFRTPWEATGVISDLAEKDAAVVGHLAGDGGRRASRPGPPERSVNRQTLKQQLDARQQVQDAQDTAKAAELALRELLGSIRAAKQHIDIGSMPFDFDPFSLDFPALTLQCLEPPPTLFASTQHPTATSWSILPPGQSQLDALRAYFQEEFRQWKIACAAATTAVTEELIYPPPLHVGRSDTKAEVLKAEKAAEKMEKHVYDHLDATYAIWNGLAHEQREELWRLELARGVGRKQKEVDKLKEGQHLLKQEVAHLKTQMQQLTRLQQPREFKIAPPSTVYLDEKLVAVAMEQGVMNGTSHVGFNLGDRHSDLGTVLTSVIDRWKNVVVAARSARSGLGAQQPLLTGELSPRNTTISGPSGHQEINHQTLQQAPHRPAVSVSESSHAPSSTSSTTQQPTTTLPAPPAMTPSINAPADEDEDGEEEDEEMSDQDAESDAELENGDAEGDTDADGDADMEGGSGNQAQHVHLTVQAPTHQLKKLEVARTRQHAGGGRSGRFCIL